MFVFKGDGSNNVTISNITIIKEGKPGKEAFTIEGCNLHTDKINIENYSVGYNITRSDKVHISNNVFYLPTSPLLKHVRAGIFNECKSIVIINNSVIFESLLNFEKIKEQRLVTYQISVNNF